MEEIFKGLVERAQYYEQFESFRNTHLSKQFGDIPVINLKMKALTMSCEVGLVDCQPEK